MRRRAFTLVELLTVIAILAVLAGILVPVLGGALGVGREAACLSSLRQIGQGWLVWGQQHPYASPAGESAPTCLRAQDAAGRTWADVLGAELGAAVLRCPAQDGEGTETPGFGLNPLCGAQWHYPSGTVGGGFLLTPEDRRAPLYTLIERPAETLVFCDSGAVAAATLGGGPEAWEEDTAAPWRPYVAFALTGPAADPYHTPPDHGYDWGNSYAGAGVGAMGWEARYRALPRHPRTAAAFADGHAEARPVAELTEPAWGAADCLYDNQP